jgi:hypothetical protein
LGPEMRPTRGHERPDSEATQLVRSDRVARISGPNTARVELSEPIVIDRPKLWPWVAGAVGVLAIVGVALLWPSDPPQAPLLPPVNPPTVVAAVAPAPEAVPVVVPVVDAPKPVVAEPIAAAPVAVPVEEKPEPVAEAVAKKPVEKVAKVSPKNNAKPVEKTIEKTIEKTAKLPAVIIPPPTPSRTIPPLPNAGLVQQVAHLQKHCADVPCAGKLKTATKALFSGLDAGDKDKQAALQKQVPGCFAACTK